MKIEITYTPLRPKTIKAEIDNRYKEMFKSDDEWENLIESLDDEVMKKIAKEEDVPLYFTEDVIHSVQDAETGKYFYKN